MARSKAPAISVTVPVHNVAPFLRRSLESVLAQDSDSFELLVYDDASTDGTYEIAREFADNSRVRVFRGRTRCGIPAARNRLLSYCRGRYLVAHDGDDLMLPDRFREQATFLDDHPDFGVIFGRLRLLNQQRRKLPEGTFEPGFEARDGWRVFTHSQAVPATPRLIFHHSSAMFRLALVRKLGGYDERWGVGEDTDLIRRLLPKTKFYFKNREFFRYRLRSGSATDHMRRRRKSDRQEWAKAAQVRSFSLGAIACHVTSDWSDFLTLLDQRLGPTGAQRSTSKHGIRFAVQTKMPRRGWMNAGVAPARVHSLMSSGIAREVNAKTGTVSIWIDRTRIRSADAAWQEAFVEPVALILPQRNRLLLNATLVRLDPGESFLVVGPARARGTRALCAAGWTLVSTEHTILQPRKSGVLGYPAATTKHGLVIRGILLAHRRVGAGVKVKRLPPWASMSILLNDELSKMRSDEPHRPGHRRHIGVAMEIAGRVPTFSVGFGSGGRQELRRALAAMNLREEL